GASTGQWLPLSGVNHHGVRRTTRPSSPCWNGIDSASRVVGTSLVCQLMRIFGSGTVGKLGSGPLGWAPGYSGTGPAQLRVSQPTTGCQPAPAEAAPPRGWGLAL